jgi:hypothetical protein
MNMLSTLGLDDKAAGAQHRSDDVTMRWSRVKTKDQFFLTLGNRCREPGLQKCEEGPPKQKGPGDLALTILAEN